MPTDRGEGFALPAIPFNFGPIGSPGYRIGVLDTQGYDEGFTAGVDSSPHIEITGTPVVETTSTSASFSFTTSIGAAEHSVDGGGYVSAVSPVVVTDLAIGPHTITIRSVNVPGHKQTFSWSVVSGGSGDDNPPSYTVVSPTPGVAPGEPGGFPANRDEAVRTPIVLRVSDVGSGLTYLVVVVQFFGSQADLDAELNGEEMTIYRRGAFRGKHVKGSTAVMDGEDLILTMFREGGWQGRFIKFDIDLIDGAGNIGG